MGGRWCSLFKIRWPGRSATHTATLVRMISWPAGTLEMPPRWESAGHRVVHRAAPPAVVDRGAHHPTPCWARRDRARPRPLGSAARRRTSQPRISSRPAARACRIAISIFVVWAGGRVVAFFAREPVRGSVVPCRGGDSASTSSTLAIDYVRSASLDGSHRYAITALHLWIRADPRRTTRCQWLRAPASP